MTPIEAARFAHTFLVSQNFQEDDGDPNRECGRALPAVWIFECVPHNMRNLEDVTLGL